MYEKTKEGLIEFFKKMDSEGGQEEAICGYGIELNDEKWKNLANELIFACNELAVYHSQLLEEFGIDVSEIY